MDTARIFQNGRSQAVRLPKAFRVSSRELEIFRRGDEIVLRERRASFAERLAQLPPLPDDFPDSIPDEPVDLVARPAL